MTTNYPDFCSKCPIRGVTEGYVPLWNGENGVELWVGEAAGEEEAARGEPFVGGAGHWLTSLCRSSSISRQRAAIINTIGCRPPKNVYPTDPKFVATARYYWEGELKRATRKKMDTSLLEGRVEASHQLAKRDGWVAQTICKECHLQPALEMKDWQRVVALGDEALWATTPRRGILLWHGSPLPMRGHIERGPKVIPVYHPAYLMRQPSLFSVAVRDFRKRPTLPPERYNLYPTVEDIQGWQGKEFVFDFEWDRTGEITLCGLSSKLYEAVVVPWEAPYRPHLKRIFEEAEMLVGHNIVGADLPHLARTSWNVRAKIFDTMLVQHLIQPDMRHGLAFVASVYSGKVFWKGTGEDREEEEGGWLGSGPQWKTWQSEDAIPREMGGYGGCKSDDEAFRLYNARDCDGNYQCYVGLREDLERYGLARTYWNVSLPAAIICGEIGRKGLRIDPSRVEEIRTDLSEEIARVEVTLPEGLRPYEVPITVNVKAPPNTYRPKKMKCKGGKKWGGPHPIVEWEVKEPGETKCVVCGRGQTPKMTPAKIIKGAGVERVAPWNSSPQVMQYALGKGCKEIINSKTGNPSADKNARKVWGREWNEFGVVDALKKLSTLRNTFAKDALIRESRVYFDLMVHGTSEGRLSCKGRREGIDPNIQNQPKSIRKIYIPDKDGWVFVSADLVQGENMLTAWLAKDWVRWERLTTPGFDEHSFMASHFFNLPIEEVSKGGSRAVLRDPGKVIGHGRNYGLGIKKTQEYLALQGFYYSEGDVREMVEIWKKLNARTAEWQSETVQLVERQTYLENPFGRRRWFQGRDYATKALAFLPASTLADTVLRMMIALFPESYGKELMELGVEKVGSLPPEWRLCIQVHDELVLQGPKELREEAKAVLEEVMTQEWKELNNFKFRVDTKYGEKSWGELVSFQ